MLTNSTPIVTVQASGNQSNVPGVLIQNNGMSSAGHSVQTVNFHGCELLTTLHVIQSSAESKPPEKTVLGEDSTHDTPRTGNHDKVTLQTYQKRTNDAKSRNQSERVEVFGCTKDVRVGAEVDGAEDAHLVENVVGRKDKFGVSNGILEKRLSSHSSLSDPETGLGSDVATEEGNSSTAEVASELLEEREVTILTECVCTHIHS
jgi:hypothetical protein